MRQQLDDLCSFGAVEPPHCAIIAQVYVSRTSLNDELVNHSILVQS